jgi:ribosome-associated protein
MNSHKHNKTSPEISATEEDYEENHAALDDEADYEEQPPAEFDDADFDDAEFDDEDEDEDESGETIVIYAGAPSTRGRGLRALAPSDDEEEIDTGPSKTKIKKQMHELRDLGKELTELSKDQVAQLDLPESLHDAIREMRSINSFGAQRRQIQYIGKLMRNVDPAPIIAKLDAWKGKSQGHTAYMHQLERWRDRLLESDGALTELLAAHPQADAQHLRSLIRNAKKERELNKPPKNYREIFQVLREILAEPV